MEKPVLCTGSDMQKSSVYTECEQEIQRFKWIESEKAGRDLKLGSMNVEFYSSGRSDVKRSPPTGFVGC